MSAFPFSHRTPLQRERGKESSGIINERWMSDNFEGEFISLHFATRIYLQIHQIVEGLPVARRQTARWTLRSVSAPELSPLARLGHALPPPPRSHRSRLRSAAAFSTAPRPVRGVQSIRASSSMILISPNESPRWKNRAGGGKRERGRYRRRYGAGFRG